jgi:hypothetical protein
MESHLHTVRPPGSSPRHPIWVSSVTFTTKRNRPIANLRGGGFQSIAEREAGALLFKRQLFKETQNFTAFVPIFIDFQIHSRTCILIALLFYTRSKSCYETCVQPSQLSA